MRDLAQSLEEQGDASLAVYIRRAADETDTSQSSSRP